MALRAGSTHIPQHLVDKPSIIQLTVLERWLSCSDCRQNGREEVRKIATLRLNPKLAGGDEKAKARNPVRHLTRNVNRVSAGQFPGRQECWARGWWRPPGRFRRRPWRWQEPCRARCPG